MSARRIELQIDELVLHGVAAADRDRVGAALRDELARLFAQPGGAAHRDSTVAAIDAGSFEHSPARGPLGLGQGVARAVHDRLQP